MIKIYNNPLKQSAQKGFTIVELMVATLVFSVILIVITVGVLSFTNDYYKGINSSTTQNTARSAVDVVAQAIQFSGGKLLQASVSGTITTYCVGNQQFDFVLGKELPSQTADTLYQSSRAPGSGCTATSCNLATGTGPGCTGKELLGPHMRLSNFVITTSSNGLYSITVRVVYGEDDLLISPSGSSPAASATDASCKIQTGSQFCYATELTTTVQPRIIGG